MTVSVSRCPVPPDQQPLNEFKSLQSSWFFGWSNAPLPKFIGRLLLLWSLGWVLMAPIAATSFDPADALGQYLLMGSGGALLLPLLVLTRLYLGWAYVFRRLHDETIVYEESGWYDGQSWTKPPADSLQDRLISNYQVQPILQRLRYCFGCTGLLCIAGTTLWALL